MVKQGILITPVLGEVLTNLAPLRMKHSASVPAYHKGKPTWLSLYLSHVPSHIVRHFTVQGCVLSLEGLVEPCNRKSYNIIIVTIDLLNVHGKRSLYAIGTGFVKRISGSNIVF